MRQVFALLVIFTLPIPASASDSILILFKKPKSCADARHALAKDPIKLMCSDPDEKVRAFSATILEGRAADEVLKQIVKRAEVETANLD